LLVVQHLNKVDDDDDEDDDDDDDDDDGDDDDLEVSDQVPLRLPGGLV